MRPHRPFRDSGHTFVGFEPHRNFRLLTSHWGPVSWAVAPVSSPGTPLPLSRVRGLPPRHRQLQGTHPSPLGWSLSVYRSTVSLPWPTPEVTLVSNSEVNLVRTGTVEVSHGSRGQRDGFGPQLLSGTLPELSLCRSSWVSR